MKKEDSSVGLGWGCSTGGAHATEKDHRYGITQSNLRFQLDLATY